ncbi:MAG: methylated-DNA--[protein]-cysteine S-methyltransferase [Thioalkalispiraceae bacterium]|jgi:methylated-DNA-[protein]-cysteine S-methyltransferase
MKESFVMQSPVGKILVETEDNHLVGLEYFSRKSVTTGKLSPFSRRVKKQIQNYFKSPQVKLALPLKMNGTDFQKKVWSQLRKIPAGKTVTYGELSTQLGSSPRAVGNACRANPIPLVIPCHRVVAKSGIGGFGGHTSGKNIDCKSWLLHHEEMH